MAIDSSYKNANGASFDGQRNISGLPGVIELKSTSEDGIYTPVHSLSADEKNHKGRQTTYDQDVADLLRENNILLRLQLRHLEQLTGEEFVHSDIEKQHY